MVVLTFAAGATLAAALQVAPAAAPADLFCRGRGDRFVSTQVKVRRADGTVVTRSENRNEPFAGAVRVKVAGGAGQALIPDAMLADDDTRGWHEIRKLAVSPARIDGKIAFNWLFSPVMTLDRETGVLRISGSMANFSGACTRYDPRTATMPTAVAPRPKVPAFAVVPVGGDARAAARAMAGQTTTRDAARSAALKADMAFRLFNAGTQPIVELVMVGKTGAASGNWLRPGERLAPRTFKALNFRNPESCTHNVRITWADTSRTVRPINFCGKDILYANAQDTWAE